MFKVPKHLSKTFNQLPEPKKQDFIRSYRIWYESELTQELIESMNRDIARSIEEQERKNSFTTLFESKYELAKNLEHRKTLRNLTKQLNPDTE